MNETTKLAYSIDEAAEAVGMSTDAIRRAIRRGDLCAVYPTTKALITVDELRAWLAAAPTSPKKSA